MEHWGWSKNWMCQGLPNGAQDAGFGDGGSITKSINAISVKETTFMLVSHYSNLTSIAARANAGIPGPAKLEASELLYTR